MITFGLGFHLEDLEQKIQYQAQRIEKTRRDIGDLNSPFRHSTDAYDET